MYHLRLLTIGLLALVLALAGRGATQTTNADPAGTITISGFTSPRDRVPLLDPLGDPPSGDSGTTNIVNDLLDLSKFGPSGLVPCTVEFVPFVTSIESGSLVNEAGSRVVDVFFAGVTDITLTSAEATELAAFLNAGGVLYISGDTVETEGPSYNPLFTALAVADAYSVGTESTGSFVQSSDPPDTTPITNGPFGTVGPLMHTAFRIIQPSATTGLATGFKSTHFILAEGQFGSGYLSMSGDPLYLNYFTGPNDPDNQTYFLNFFAHACASGPEPTPTPTPTPTPLPTPTPTPTPLPTPTPTPTPPPTPTPTPTPGCDPGVDTDGDGFDSDVECYVGTDPLDDCPDVTGTPGLCPGPSCDGDDAWPFDINVDTWSNALDVLLFKGHIQCQVGDSCYDPRFDLNADEWINVLDVLLYKGHIQVQCANP